MLRSPPFLIPLRSPSVTAQRKTPPQCSDMDSNQIKSEMDADADGYAVKSEESLNEMIINRIRACEALWNIKHKKFRDIVHKKLLWAKIGQDLGVNEAFLRTRWRTLRDRYLKEKKKIERQRRTSRNSEGRNSPYAAGQPWILLPQLDFLRDCVHPRTNYDVPRYQDLTHEECDKETEKEIFSDSTGFVQINSTTDSLWAIVQTDNGNAEDPSSSGPLSPNLPPAGFSHARGAEPSSPEELFYMSIARTVEGLDEWTRLLIRQDVMAVVAKHIREARIRR